MFGNTENVLSPSADRYDMSITIFENISVYIVGDIHECPEIRQRIYFVRLRSIRESTLQGSVVPIIYFIPSTLLIPTVKMNYICAKHICFIVGAIHELPEYRASCIMLCTVKKIHSRLRVDFVHNGIGKKLQNGGIQPNL